MNHDQLRELLDLDLDLEAIAGELPASEAV